ncbi:GlxA family transcriptional regulator [Vreelandella boliviensis]|uniref:GlxA family transcriptional regulator n=1 Tax=Vreelandella boliviensis LC1 TaxID=1072583 RepID=A0A265E202_9GAMM|nr:GlxA family transcriptional regulator [Halomonas boliviensis]EHJ94523.1 HTH-type transcriptional regulator glxA [Halomonas boliviensis LC1]OZT75622.1 GlxA family transcriptional regulator [Halomonas boliviensis LC1]
MRLQYQGQSPERIGFLLLPRFAMVAFFSAVEPLRIANRIAGHELFQWRVMSESGEPVTASNNMTLMADEGLTPYPDISSLAVCASFEPEKSISRQLTQWLHRQAQRGCVLGSMDTGAIVLASAGLLDDQTITLHWESLPVFRESYPHLKAVESLFEISKSGFSCAGGTAAMDMSLDLIARRHGDTLAQQVSEQLIHANIRHPEDRQRFELSGRLGSRKPALLRSVALMEANLEHPIVIADISEQVNISLRQLQRLFEQELGSSPRRYYLALRLERSRQLLRETQRDIIEIALACGFNSASSFARSFRHYYGYTPSDVRLHARPNVAPVED